MMAKKILKNMLTICSFPKTQKMMDALFRFSLINMNIGGGGCHETSGEEYVLKYIKRKSGDNLICFDVGANVGNYSLLLNRIFNEYAEIHAFEPSKEIFEKLKKSIYKAKNIKIYNIGFGSKTDTRPLYKSTVQNGLSSLYKRDLRHTQYELDSVELVKIKTIDDFCTKQKIDHIDFLKLDIEGNEFEALTGAEKFIKEGKIKYIQFEFGGCNIDSRTFFRDFYYLLKDKYRLYRVLKNGLCPIFEYKESYEIFITTNFLAEKK